MCMYMRMYTLTNTRLLFNVKNFVVVDNFEHFSQTSKRRSIIYYVCTFVETNMLLSIRLHRFETKVARLRHVTNVDNYVILSF